MNFFSKSPKKSSSLRKTTTPNDADPNDPPQARQPLKKAHSSKSTGSKAKDETAKAAASSNNNPSGSGSTSARNSRTFPKVSGSSRQHLDPTEHPLNLPPELRRLSALSAMSDSERMDIDGEGPNGASSPVTSPAPPQNIPGSFEIPKLNGRKDSTTNGEGPVPPPHKSNPSSPAPAAVPTPEDAEAFKTAGNKFYKAKEYRKAIEEYTKGAISRSE